MKITIPKETQAYEKRVAISPDVVKNLLKAGFSVVVEKDAGLASFFADAAYTLAGATIEPNKETLYKEADVILKVNPPSADEVRLMKPEAVLISFLYAYTQPELVAALLEKKITDRKSVV